MEPEGLDIFERLDIFDILGMVFLILKLLNVIKWSWLWVTAPFWGKIVLFLVIVICVEIKESKK